MPEVCKVHQDFVEIQTFQTVLFTTDISTFQLAKLLSADKYDVKESFAFDEVYMLTHTLIKSQLKIQSTFGLIHFLKIKKKWYLYYT